MKTMLFCDMIAFFTLAGLLFAVGLTCKLSRSRTVRRAVTIGGTVLIICVIAVQLFLNAIAFGIIGLVPDRRTGAAHESPASQEEMPK